MAFFGDPEQKSKRSKAHMHTNALTSTHSQRLIAEITAQIADRPVLWNRTSFIAVLESAVVENMIFGPVSGYVVVLFPLFFESLGLMLKSR